MKTRIVAILLLCLLLAGCANVAESKPLGTFTPNISGDHDHDHDHTTRPPEGTRPSRPTTPPLETAPPTTVPLGPADVLLSLPNEAGDGFITQKSSTNNLDYDGVILLLKVNGVVSEYVLLNSCKRDGDLIRLDLNQAFLDQLKSAANERLIIGSIVNTFISAFQCESVCITVDGATISTANATYDAPLTFFE